jgi:hypothetical protein
VSAPAWFSDLERGGAFSAAPASSSSLPSSSSSSALAGGGAAPSDPASSSAPGPDALAGTAPCSLPAAISALLGPEIDGLCVDDVIVLDAPAAAGAAACCGLVLDAVVGRLRAQRATSVTFLASAGSVEEPFRAMPTPTQAQAQAPTTPSPSPSPFTGPFGVDEADPLGSILAAQAGIAPGAGAGGASSPPAPAPGSGPPPASLLCPPSRAGAHNGARALRSLDQLLALRVREAARSASSAGAGAGVRAPLGPLARRSRSDVGQGLRRRLGDVRRGRRP